MKWAAPGRDRVTAGLRRATLAILLLTGCSDPGTSAPLLVFAASDLRVALPELVRGWEAAGGAPVDLVFGSTSGLGTQIEHGAPADVYLAADEADVNRLIGVGMLLSETRTRYGRGRLAVIAAPGRHLPHSLEDLLDAEFAVVALANPRHAPYGRAAAEAMEAAGVMDALRSRLVFTGNVGQVERQVSSGSADAGIVALALVTGAAARSHTPIDPSLHRPLRQTGAVVATSAKFTEARAFLDYLAGSEGQAVLARYGLVPVNE